jgi:hypothetical protein
MWQQTDNNLTSYLKGNTTHLHDNDQLSNVEPFKAER